MKGDKERCVDAGMDDYLSKPFEVEDLLKKVEYWAKSKVST
jgi:CheY-like chemotaxis protein